jgi:hypothetical protein
MTFYLMSIRKLQFGATSALVGLGVAVLVWQQIRVRGLVAENGQLQASLAELPALRQEVEQLRKIQLEQAELDRLRGSQAQVQSEAAVLRGRLAGLSRIERENTQLRADLERQSEKLRSAAKDSQFAVDMTVMKERAAQKALAQLATLRTSLNLTREQGDAICDLLQKRAELVSQFYETGSDGKRVLRPGSRESEKELAEIHAGSIFGSDIEEQIKSQLSPEQQAAFERLKSEEAAMKKNARVWRVEKDRGLVEEGSQEAPIK